MRKTEKTGVRRVRGKRMGKLGDFRERGREKIPSRVGKKGEEQKEQ